MTPRPRINLVLYYGLLGAHAAWRSRLPGPGVAVPTAAADAVVEARADSARPIAPTAQGSDPPPSESARPARSGSNWLWSQLMRRSFGYNVLACPNCGGRFRLVLRRSSGPPRASSRGGRAHRAPRDRPANPSPSRATGGGAAAAAGARAAPAAVSVGSRLISLQSPSSLARRPPRRVACVHTSPGRACLAVRSCSLVRVVDTNTRRRHHLRRRAGVVYWGLCQPTGRSSGLSS
jgi:hypothetical protein